MHRHSEWLKHKVWHRLQKVTEMIIASFSQKSVSRHCLFMKNYLLLISGRRQINKSKEGLEKIHKANELKPRLRLKKC